MLIIQKKSTFIILLINSYSCSVLSSPDDSCRISAVNICEGSTKHEESGVSYYTKMSTFLGRKDILVSADSQCDEAGERFLSEVDESSDVTFCEIAFTENSIPTTKTASRKWVNGTFQPSSDFSADTDTQIFSCRIVENAMINFELNINLRDNSMRLLVINDEQTWESEFSPVCKKNIATSLSH